MNTPLDYFGLRPDADEREVKRAYAKMLKSIRPDEDEAGFQQLHAAYQQALTWVRRHAQNAPAVASNASTAAPNAPAVASNASAVASTTTRPPISEPAEPSAEAPAPATPSEPFQPAAFLHDLSPRLTGNDAASLLAWLHQQPALWSLEHKRLAGQIVLNQLGQHTPPVASASFDTLLQFFGFDQVSSGVDPIRLHALRTELNEQFSALQRARASDALDYPCYASPDGRLTSPWDRDEAPTAGDRFFHWFLLQAPRLRLDELDMHLRVGRMLMPAADQANFARRVLERLLSEAPPLPASHTHLLLKLLLPQTDPWAAQPALRDLATRLQIKWLVQPGNTAALSKQTRAGQSAQTERSTSMTRRLLRCAQRPFAWWRVLLAGWIPTWPTMMGVFLRQLSGRQTARLHEVFDPKTVDFWIAASDRERISLPRVAIGVVRCLLGLLCAGLAVRFNQLAPDSGGPHTQPLDPWMLAGIAIAAWLGYLAYLLAYFWQRAPETPGRPYALARFLFIPMMIALGLIVYAASGNAIAAQIVLVPLVPLAFQREQARSKSPLQLGSINPLVRLLLLGLSAGFLIQVLMVPVLPACLAFVFWMIDARQRENRPSIFRRDRPTSTPTRRR